MASTHATNGRLIVKGAFVLSGKSAVMESDTSPRLKIVGKLATVKSHDKTPRYFTPLHERWVGKTGRVHAVVAGAPRDNPLVKLGFEDGTQIVFFRLAELEIHDAPAQHPLRHGKRGSHLPDVESDRSP